MLKNKHILITAGPTWVAIDKVRVLSNISTGETGLLIARQALKEGAKITLLLGPVEKQAFGRSIEIIPFCFFSEFSSLIKQLLKSRKFDAVIHAAAVSDYQPKNRISLKLKSGIRNFNLRLEPTEKLINKIKQINSKVFLVGFKLEVASDMAQLIRSTRNIFKTAKPDLMVANALNGHNYKGIILDCQKNILAKANSRREVALKLIKLLKDKL